MPKYPISPHKCICSSVEKQSAYVRLVRTLFQLFAAYSCRVSVWPPLRPSPSPLSLILAGLSFPKAAHYSSALLYKDDHISKPESQFLEACLLCPFWTPLHVPNKKRNKLTWDTQPRRDGPGGRDSPALAEKCISIFIRLENQLGFSTSNLKK